MFSSDRLVIDFVTDMNGKPCMRLEFVTVVVFAEYDIVRVVFGMVKWSVLCAMCGLKGNLNNVIEQSCVTERVPVVVL